MRRASSVRELFVVRHGESEGAAAGQIGASEVMALTHFLHATEHPY